MTLSNGEPDGGANVDTNTAMRSRCSLLACAGEAKEMKDGVGGEGRFMKRDSDGNRCGDSTYGGRSPSTKVAAVW